MHNDNEILENKIRKLRANLKNSFRPDLRELTSYCRALGLTLHPIFASEDQATGDEGIALARFTDDTLVHAVAQISTFKEVEAPLHSQKDSTLVSICRILSSLANKAEDRSRESGNYVHLTHVFYSDFCHTKEVAKNTFYAYRNAVQRYALKRVADLLPYFPANVDKDEVSQTFRAFFAPVMRAKNNVTNVDIPDSRAASNVDNVTTHRLTRILLDKTVYETTEQNAKLAAYPWFSARRHRTAAGVSELLTKLEMVELAECVRFICHYPPDLLFERRGIAGKKKGRDFVVDDLFSDGLLLNAPKPSFRVVSSSKKVYERQDTETRRELGKRNKRLASTEFNPSHFWLAVAAKIQDTKLKAVIASQLITGCRPSELVDGVVVAAEPSDIADSLGRLHFTMFGSKVMAALPASASDTHSAVAAYVDFLSNSSLATNARIRGQFYHTESVDVFPQFPERVWLFDHLMERSPPVVVRERASTVAFLLEKVCHYRKLEQRDAMRPDVLELRGEEQLQLVQHLRTETAKAPSDDDIATAIRHRNYLIEQSRPATLSDQGSVSARFDSYILQDLLRLMEADAVTLPLTTNPYQAAKIVRFRFLPKVQSFPLMARLDAIPFSDANVDNVGDDEPSSLPRLFLGNEFTDEDMDFMRVPEHLRIVIPHDDFAALKRERAEYARAAVVHLGKRYRAAADGLPQAPTPYTARHRIMSDLKGLRNEDGQPVFTKEDIASKAGHASTASQSGYGKAAFAEKGNKNRARSLKNIRADRSVKDPKATAGLRKLPSRRSDVVPPTQKYEPKD